MSISVFDFGVLQFHWMLAGWDATIPHPLEGLRVSVTSLSVVADVYMVESSAYMDTHSFFTASGRSLVKNRNE